MKPKKKECPTCGKVTYIWSRKFGCKKCSIKNKSTKDIRKTSEKQQVSNMKRKPINKVSDKQKKRNAEYLKVRLEYLNAHKLCEVCGSSASEIHHKSHRAGSMLTDTNYFLAVCRSCHTKIHNNVSWAEENGYLIRGRNSK